MALLDTTTPEDSMLVSDIAEELRSLKEAINGIVLESTTIPVLVVDPDPLTQGMWVNLTERVIKVYTGGELLLVPLNPY